MRNWRLLWFFCFSLGISQPVLAHGARIDYQQASAIVIRATYDDGTPMAKAQAVVYAPDDPATPWLKGMTDESGKFTFVPDRELAGNWDVKVRQSGHGNIISIPLTDSSVVATKTQTIAMNAGSGQGYSLGQKLLMTIAISWGFIGTALFFARK